MASARRAIRRAKMEIPVPAGDVIERVRLTGRLDAMLAADHQLESVLVCAPPGFGKTTLVSSWTATLPDQGYSLAVCNLDATESHTFRFWSLLLTSLSEAVPDERMADLTAPYRPGSRTFLSDLAAALEGWPLVVVVENLHEIVDPALLADLDLWLGLVPPTTKVVLTSRSDPPLMSLQARRLRGAIDQLRANDLAFTPDELRALAPSVDPDTRRSIWRRTEGWPALIRLMLMTVHAATGEPVVPTGEDPVLAEYLFTELFRKQPERIQSLMLVCSTLETIPLDLVASITGIDEAGRVLEELVLTSGLVTRVPSPTGDQPWYRFHPLLRAYLRGELLRSDRHRESTVYAAAAPWFLDRGLNVEAVAYARACSDPDLRERIVAEVGLAMVNAGESSLLLTALGDARSRRQAGSAWIHVVAAAALLDLARVPEAVGELNLLRESEEDADDLRIVREAVRLNTGRCHGERPCVEELVAGIDTADADVRIYWQSQVATALLWEGQFEQAEALLESTAELAKGLSRDAVLIDTLSMLASARVVWSDHAGADACLDDAFECARAHGWGASPRLAFAHLLSAWTCRQRLDDDGARRHVALARSLVHPSSDPMVLGSVRILDGALRFEADTSQVEEVDQMHEVWHALAASGVAPAWVMYAALMQARFSLQLHRAARVREIIDDLRAGAGEHGELPLVEAMLEGANGHHRRALELVRAVTSGEVDVTVPISLVDAWALEAALQVELGDSFAATAAARQALDLAVELGALRPLLDSGGERLLGLLLRERGRWGHHEPLVERLVAVAGLRPASATVLTDRELEVLVELPTLRTVDEIAHSMYVSVNTVKTHLRNVYRKLGVTSRRDAVKAARLQGLL